MLRKMIKHYYLSKKADQTFVGDKMSKSVDKCGDTEIKGDKSMKEDSKRINDNER